MKLAIIGSRDFTNYPMVFDEAVKFEPTEIISGGAKGADTLAERFAREQNLPAIIFLPKFKTDPQIKYHPSYYHIRNREIVDYADHILAFMSPGSKGTKSAVKYAESIGKPVTLVEV